MPPYSSPGPDDIARAPLLTAQLVANGAAALQMLGGYGVTHLDQPTIAPGVRAWRLTTTIQPIPQIATLAMDADLIAAGVSVWPVLRNVSGPPGLIIVDVYLMSATGPQDPGVIGTGFVFLSVTAAGGNSGTAPSIIPPPPP